jgi:hypothetical protein
MLAEETSKELDVLNGADAGEIPQRVIQHDEDFRSLVEGLQ